MNTVNDIDTEVDFGVGVFRRPGADPFFDASSYPNMVTTASGLPAIPLEQVAIGPGQGVRATSAVEVPEGAWDIQIGFETSFNAPFNLTGFVSIRLLPDGRYTAFLAIETPLGGLVDVDNVNATTSNKEICNTTVEEQVGPETTDDRTEVPTAGLGISGIQTNNQGCLESISISITCGTRRTFSDSSTLIFRAAWGCDGDCTPTRQIFLDTEDREWVTTLAIGLTLSLTPIAGPPAPAGPSVSSPSLSPIEPRLSPVARSTTRRRIPKRLGCASCGTIDGVDDVDLSELVNA
ncbi:MAG: hypothetical protein AAGB51_06285 [Planctomycetota bacterium]